MRLLLFLLFIITDLVVIAQKDDKIKGSPDKLAYVDFSLRAQRIAPSDIKLPFSSIKIIDSRFDTSKIGFVPIEFYVPSPTSGLQQVISFKKSACMEELPNQLRTTIRSIMKTLLPEWISASYSNEKVLDFGN